MGELIRIDKQLLLWFNGSDSQFLDSVIMTLTAIVTWIPLYVALLYVVVKANRNWRGVLLALMAAGLCVLLAGTIDDTFVKPLVARWRPTHDPEIGALIDTVNGYRGGNYGFFSAHASNTFSIAVFFSLLMRQRLLTIFMVGWSLVNCYTRLYLGVHYPGDILVGLLWGGLVGYGVHRLHAVVYRRFVCDVPAVYTRQLILVPVAVLCLALLYAFVRAFFS
jgi:undecaprenyl-diphosphatase